MKKMIVLVLLCFGIVSPARAQSKTIKTMLEQIAATQVYIGYVQKGYTVVKKGLDVIGDFKRGEFNLHTDYFNSLSNVNPTVQGYARVGEMFFLQGRILERWNDTQGLLQGSPYMHSDELEYLERVFARLLDDCETLLDELEAVTTDNQLTMKDSERLQRVDILYEKMLDAYNFCQQFTGEAKMLVQSRKRENVDTQMARRLQGL